MINGLGVVGWGVGGIEAEAGMLGQPVYFLTPDVVGVHLTGQLREGVTATDLALHITQLLRAQKVVGKFVEFYGEGAASLPVPDRATIGNMAPEYGATMGYFPVDAESVELSARHRPHATNNATLRKLFSRAKNVWDAAERRDRLQRRSRTGSGGRAAQRRRTEAAAGPDQSAGTREDISRAVRKTGHRTAATAKRMSIFAKSISWNLNGSAAAERRHGFERTNAKPGNRIRATSGTRSR